MTAPHLLPGAPTEFPRARKDVGSRPHQEMRALRLCQKTTPLGPAVSSVWSNRPELPLEALTSGPAMASAQTAAVDPS